MSDGRHGMVGNRCADDNGYCYIFAGMVITVNTDASFSNKWKIGAYAFWVISKDFKIKKSGMIKSKVESPTHAECMAIVNALHAVFYMLFQDNTMSKVRMIIVNTDSMNAKHVFENDELKIREYRLKKYSQQFYGKFEWMCKKTFGKKCKVEFQFRHVKAHQNTDTPRTYINDWCDKEAKKHMGEQLEQLDPHIQKKYKEKKLTQNGIPSKQYST